MSVTYLSAADRTLQQARANRWRLDWSDGLLAAASVMSLLAIALAYAGTMSAARSGAAQFARPAPARDGPPGEGTVNLNAPADSAALEPALAAAFTNPSERRSAAREFAGFLAEQRATHGDLPNVGALARARAASGAVAESAPLLLTSSQLAALKPRFIVRTREDFRNQVFLFGLLYVLGFHMVSAVWRVRGIRADPLLLVVAHLLTGIGFAALLSRPDPLRDTFLVGRYTEGILLGLALMAAVSLIDFRSVVFLELSYVPLLASLALSTALLLFGSGPGGSSAKVNLGPVQPIEAIRLLLALFLAGYFTRRWELLRGVRETTIRSLRVPAWLDLPRAEYLLPVAAGVGAALFFFFLQKDLGPALYTCCLFLTIYAVARGRIGMAIAGLAVLLLAFYAGNVLHLSHTLVDRVSMWRSPWDNAVAGGDQIAQALWAMSTGALSGTGFGLGDTRYLPAGHTDLILAAIGEEQGAIGLLLVALLYGVLAWRGFRIGRLAHNDYGFFLATTMTLFLIVPVFIMASGVFGVAPLTGVVTPFLSYGGSAMVTNFVALGVLAAIHGDRRPPIDFTPFRAPMRSLGVVLSAAALFLLIIAVNVQVVRADDYIIRPHRGLQADGGRRFVYNPRVLDVVRRIPRGTIFDRRGVPLATDDAGVIANARDGYRKLGISLADECPAVARPFQGREDVARPFQGRETVERCYPLGGPAFHLLGNARTRVNWSALNTSYIERDAEDTLRGFDDHATIVDGALRRDYSAIVPLLRDREVRLNMVRLKPGTTDRVRPRDVALTIDAGLQLRAAAIVASYAKRAAGSGAAVVVDPDTGELLASVSYPWPNEFPADERLPAAEPAFLDRARYGLYPPGSTFKLVTASAALREHAGLQGTVFACSRLTDGRSGARIAGWSRPIRDDVLDAHPHGSIDLHDGLVRSCNAYFAQLAVKLGPDPLVAAASQLGIALTQGNDTRSRVAATLPQVGYGQGDVLATPLRMARVAAAIASDGRLREVRWTKTGAVDESSMFLDPESARLLARYMRDAVLTGTGRSLRDHPWRIAGKTGTAELTGKPSHSWFVGFAPYGGPATKRIAFAVIIENAGYGSANAAPAAGEIVSAAAATGLLK
jgi:cell division protein FtsW (lipid II flippase)